MADSGEKPSVLIIGGLGYIGRFLALHIHKEKLASEVRLVDKVLPQLAWLAPEFAEACSQDKFMQADASRERECFAPRHFLGGTLGLAFDCIQTLVINTPQSSWR
jgi:nucleoside-diphosphate-sugar epimerase